MVETWITSLEAGDLAAAWDHFVERYRRLIFAAIRHYAQDYDDMMDVFAHVCEALRDHDLRRLRSYVEQGGHRARFSTWLVTVVRHLTIDWFRQRDGRRRISRVAEALPLLRRRIFEYVFVEHRGHVEAFELLRARDAPALSFGAYLAELRATYLAVALTEEVFFYRRRREEERAAKAQPGELVLESEGGAKSDEEVLAELGAYDQQDEEPTSPEHPRHFPKTT